MIQNWINNHGSWWESFTSSFIGTLLGIVITFGTSAYLQYQEQKDTAHKYLLMMIEDMNTKTDLLTDYLEFLHMKDSVFDAVSVAYLSSEDYDQGEDIKILEEMITETDVEDFFYEFAEDLYLVSSMPKNYVPSSGQRYFSDNPMIRNLEVLDVFEDISIVSYLEDIYSEIGTTYDKIMSYEKLRREMYDRFYYNSDDFEYETAWEMLMEFMNMNLTVPLTLVNHHALTVSIGNDIDDIRKAIRYIIEDMEIDENELELLYKNRAAAKSKELSIEEVIDARDVLLDKSETPEMLQE